MLFRNSRHLLIDNFGMGYKMLLYKLIIGLLTVSIALSFVIPNLQYIFESEELAAFLGTIGDFFSSLVSGDVEYLAQFEEKIASTLSALAALVTSKVSHIVVTAVGIIFTYILLRFLDTFGNYSFGCMLNEKMNSYAEISFFACAIKSFASGCLYAICYVLLSFAFDLALIFLCYLMFFMALSFFPFVLTLFFSSALLFCGQALKLTYLSGWMPAMAEGNLPLGKAFRYTFHIKASQIGKMYSNYLIAVYLIAVINVVFAVCTLFSALLITVPASFLFLLCIQFVNYYTMEGKKYFVNYYKIADNKDRGEKSTFLDENDIKEERY